MIVIGVVLLVLAALAAVAAVHSGQHVQVHLNGYGQHLTTSVLWVFCAGAVAMLLLVLALALFARSARRGRMRRRELKAQRAEEAAAQSRQAEARQAEARVAETPANAPLDVRDQEPAPAAHAAHAYGDADDPGPERRYVPGEDA